MCSCGARCFFAGRDDLGPCAGEIVLFDEPNQFSNSEWVHVCRNHERVEHADYRDRSVRDGRENTKRAS